MDKLLKHITEITRNRDHELLDISTVTALNQLTGAPQVRILDIVQVKDEVFIQPRAWLDDGKAVAAEESGIDAEALREPLADFPALAECIDQRNASVSDTTANGRHRLWRPIWLNERASTCIEIVSDKPLPSEMLEVIHGVSSVYSNYQSLIDYSERDSLTGLLNRKTFDEKFTRIACGVPDAQPETEWKGAEERRHAHDIKSNWLAVVDIDHFKKINDTFGHLYGDEVLILIANILRSCFRAQDKVFRFGGEEFVILLRSATLEDARKALERFRQTVEHHDFPQVGRVTVSVGFVGITAATPVVILGHADQALYYAKEHGRNQVCHYDELVQSGELQSQQSNDDVEFF